MTNVKYDRHGRFPIVVEPKLFYSFLGFCTIPEQIPGDVLTSNTKLKSKHDYILYLFSTRRLSSNFYSDAMAIVDGRVFEICEWNSYFYLRNAIHFKYKNELLHLFEVNTTDHKDDVRPELRIEWNYR